MSDTIHPKIYVIDWFDGDHGGLCREEGYFTDKAAAAERAEQLNCNDGVDVHMVAELELRGV